MTDGIGSDTLGVLPWPQGTNKSREMPVVEAAVPVSDDAHGSRPGRRQLFTLALASLGVTPNVPELLKRPEFDSSSIDYVTFFLGRETVLANRHSEMTAFVGS